MDDDVYLFAGESVDDCGGGYSESIAEMCDELQNGDSLLPLLIATPNGRDEAGTSRDDKDDIDHEDIEAADYSLQHSGPTKKLMRQSMHYSPRGHKVTLLPRFSRKILQQ